MSLSRKLAFVALLYVIEGFPMGVYVDVWPVYFRRHGVSLTELGLYGGLSMAWAVKVLWSPLVDRLGEKRRWIAGAMLGMAACLLVIAAAPPELGPLLWLAMGTYCIASATQDIAIDAYTIGLVDHGEEGPANSVRTGAYRVGMLLSGSGLLFLPRWIGWDGTFAAAAVLSASMAACVFICPKVDPPRRSGDHPPLWSRWRGRPQLWQVAAFVMLYRIGDRAMRPMIKPLWVDRGFTDEQIAIWSTSVGVLAVALGAVAGGIVVARIGIYRALWWLGAAALASNFAYAAAALPGMAANALIAASVVESFCGGLAAAAFMSFLMRICDREHAAVEYALLTALYGAAGALVEMPSGALAERIGYAGYFSLTASFALPGLVFLPASRSWLDSP